jgi:nucleotide-binding universal stress UspA family protein
MSRIIVGVDSSDRADDAAAFARDIAGATGASVILTCVFPYAPVPARVSGAQVEDYLRADADAILARLRDQVDGLRDAESRTVADPSPARGLHETAEAEDAALIVVGSSHHGHAGRILAGSTATRLLNGSPCAVAVVPRGYNAGRRGFDRIGCAFDSSAEAMTALETATAAAAALGAELTVVHAFDIGSQAEIERMAGEGVGPEAWQLERDVQQEMEATVGRLAPRVKTSGVLREGRPAAVLADESEHLDLLFAGSRGYGPHSAVLLGSVTAQLLDHAACPVILLPRGARPSLLDLFTHAVTA